MNTKRFFWIVVLVMVGALLVAACAPSPPEAPAARAEQDQMEEHADDGKHAEEAHTHSPEDHMAGMHHDVPEEASAVPNPIAATDESIAAGQQIYATNCAVCHGETGQGDGPGAAGLEQKPANLHEGHVQGLTDGALFYIISHGVPDTPMPVWENVLSEEDRWQVVNFIRTFKEDGTVDEIHEGEHDDDGEHAAEESDHAEDEHTDEGEHAEDGG